MADFTSLITVEYIEASSPISLSSSGAVVEQIASNLISLSSSGVDRTTNLISLSSSGADPAILISDRYLNPCFTPKALSTYAQLQQLIILKHLKSWERLWSTISPTELIPLHLLFRDMNLQTSQTVFLGKYLSSEAWERFRVDYDLFNAGLMKLPFDLPGFAFRKAKLGAEQILKTLTH
ncbi:hypothetical protein Gotur_028100 [Gossypium turneri]